MLDLTPENSNLRLTDILQPRRTAIFKIAAALLLLAAAGCTSVAQITNLEEDACGGAFQGALTSILLEQGEKSDVAESLVRQNITMLSLGRFGPRPFLISSSSGTDYTFFVQKKKSGCLLRLYGRQKGFVSYTNNLTYISTRRLPGCACSE